MRKLKKVIIPLKKLNKILTDKQKKKAGKVLITIIVGSFFELLGVSAIMPLMQLLMKPDKLMDMGVVSRVFHALQISSIRGALVAVCVGIILLYIFKNCYLIFSNYVQYDFSTLVKKELSVKLLKAYMRRPYTFFLNVNSGEILRGCNDDVDGVYSILEYLFTIISEGMACVLIGIYIVSVDPLIAFCALFLLTFIVLLIVFIFKPIVGKLGEKFIIAQAQKNKAIFQTIGGIKELYVMQRKDLFVETYEEASEDVRRTQRNHEALNASPERIIEGLSISGLIGIVLYRLLLGVDITDFVPTLATFAMAAFKIMPSAGKISSRVTKIMYSIPMLDNVYENVIMAEKELKEQEKYESEHHIEDKQITFSEVLDIKHVTWQYAEQNVPVLDNITLQIHKGECIALIGASGAGKTTLADVILGLLKPLKGQILMDGHDVYAMPMQWAKIIGYVPQSVYLIDDTIRNNVAFGMKQIDDKDIWNALEQAQLKEFVQHLPNGLDTVVGERGIKFSGGQRQRVAIARALFNRPQILVLDEATAALDNETENALMEAIEKLQGQITMIIVAHRLSTIRNCDRIYEVTGGNVQLRNKSDILDVHEE